MAQTTISDLWVPDIWIPATREKQATTLNALNSGICVKSPVLDEIASGAGNSANVPTIKDTTDDDDEIQVENQAPTNGELLGSKQIVPICNRVKAYDSTALAAAVSGIDPVAEVTAQIADGRMKRRQKTFIAILRGAFNGLGASGVAAALQALRVDAFDETGNDANNDQTMSPELFIAAKALLGEIADSLAAGAILAHSNVIATLEILDKESFKDGVESALPFTIRTYRGIPIFPNDSLVRAGTGNGYVYDTYICGRGIVGMGEKKQSDKVGEVASLLLDDSQKAKNNVAIYDRTRFALHLNGMRWVGVPAGQSPTNAELATGANWELAYTSAARVGAVCIRTNR